MTKPPSDDHIFRYLAGTLSGDEAVQVREWLEHTAAGRGASAGIRTALLAEELEKGIQARQQSNDMQRTLETLWGRIDDEVVEDRSQQIPRLVRGPLLKPHIGGQGLVRQTLRQGFFGGERARKRWLALGGVVVASVIALLVRPSLVHRRSSESVAHYATGPGERMHVTLGRGTRILLGPATRITVAVNMDGYGTTVHVTGEAAFQVIHHNESLFTVVTRQSITRVLGTTFLIRQYPTDPDTRVAVAEGRVEVGSVRVGRNPAAVVLAAGMLGSVNDSGEVHAVERVVPNDIIAWSNGILVFHRVPVRDVLRDVSRAYAVDIQIADSNLAGRMMTWRFPVTTHPLRNALEELSVLLGVHVTHLGKVIILAPGRPASAKPAKLFVPSTTEIQYGR